MANVNIEQKSKLIEIDPPTVVNRERFNTNFNDLDVKTINCIHIIARNCEI